MTRDEAMDILGVRPGDSRDDVRASYRRKAQQYHPDKNKSKDATRQFQRIQAAYELLKDHEPQRQKARPQPPPPPPPKPRVGKFTVTEIYEGGGYSRDDWAGPNMNQRRGAQGRKLKHIEVSGTLEDAFLGGPIKIPVPDDRTLTGALRSILVLPGVYDNDLIATVPLAGAAEAKVKFRLVPDKAYTLSDRWGTVSMPVDVDALRLIVGGTLKARMVDGEVLSVEVAPGSARQIVISGRGYWCERSTTRGDCVLQVNPVIKELHSYSRDDLARLRELLN